MVVRHPRLDVPVVALSGLGNGAVFAEELFPSAGIAGVDVEFEGRIARNLGRTRVILVFREVVLRDADGVELASEEFLEGGAVVGVVGGQDIGVDAFDAIEVRVFLDLIPIRVAGEGDELVGFPGFKEVRANRENVVDRAVGLVGVVGAISGRANSIGEGLRNRGIHARAKVVHGIEPVVRDQEGEVDVIAIGVRAGDDAALTSGQLPEAVDAISGDQSVVGSVGIEGGKASDAALAGLRGEFGATVELVLAVAEELEGVDVVSGLDVAVVEGRTVRFGGGGAVFDAAVFASAEIDTPGHVHFRGARSLGDDFATFDRVGDVVLRKHAIPFVTSFVAVEAGAEVAAFDVAIEIANLRALVIQIVDGGWVRSFPVVKIFLVFGIGLTRESPIQLTIAKNGEAKVRNVSRSALNDARVIHDITTVFVKGKTS